MKLRLGSIPDLMVPVRFGRMETFDHKLSLPLVVGSSQTRHSHVRVGA